jgi:hypothetical protein
VHVVTLYEAQETVDPHFPSEVLPTTYFISVLCGVSQYFILFSCHSMLNSERVQILILKGSPFRLLNSCRTTNKKITNYCLIRTKQMETKSKSMQI